MRITLGMRKNSADAVSAWAASALDGCGCMAELR
jgi:hypothetical protein